MTSNVRYDAHNKTYGIDPIEGPTHEQINSPYTSNDIPIYNIPHFIVIDRVIKNTPTYLPDVESGQLNILKGKVDNIISHNANRNNQSCYHTTLYIIVLGIFYIIIVGFLLALVLTIVFL